MNPSIKKALKRKIFWKKASSILAMTYPNLINPDMYNWETSSWAIIKYCPQKLDIQKANLENILVSFPEYKGLTLKEIKKKTLLKKV